ncbi:MAG: DMT family transporter [Acetatifactor sp.]|nr:DMT family transporter [Acetatifactor sp.]
MSKKTKHSLLLLLAALIWGLAFVSQSKGMDYMKPLTFNGVRSLIGAFSLLLFILVTGRYKKERNVNWKATGLAGILCGIALTSASTLQQFGILYTTVGKAGFITALYIVFVPIFGIFLKKKVSAVVWFGAILAAVGMYFLCMTESFRLGTGDILIFLCAVIFAIHIMLADHFSVKTDGVIVSCIQFTICGLVCTTGALIWEHPTFRQLGDGLGALLYAGVLSCGVAYTLQLVGQEGVNPTVAALLLSLESVFATIAGFLAFKIGFLTTDQTMTGRQIAGCALVFAAVILVQLPAKWFRIGKNRS